MGCKHHPNWRTHIFQRGGPNHQPDMVIGLLVPRISSDVSFSDHFFVQHLSELHSLITMEYPEIGATNYKPFPNPTCSSTLLATVCGFVLHSHQGLGRRHGRGRRKVLYFNTPMKDLCLSDLNGLLKMLTYVAPEVYVANLVCISNKKLVIKLQNHPKTISILVAILQ